MEFSTEKETRIVPAQTFTTSAREYSTIRLKGPCLVCEREIEYGKRWPYDEEHARKQFKAKRREHMLERLRDARGWSPHDVPHVETIEGMVCPKCQAECRELRKAAARQVQAEEERQQEQVEKRRVVVVAHYEWRTATAEEVRGLPPYRTEFRAVFPNFELHEIVFRWRAVPGKCRGNSYLMRVGMWVDGKLAAHYHEWDLQHFDDQARRGFYTSEDEWPTSDLFGRGFCHWIERAFQPRLVQLSADQVWGPEKYADAKLDTDEVLDRPGILLIEWIDGTRYMHVLPSLNLPEVAEWAERRLDLRIEERAFRPVWRPAEAAAAEETQE